MHAIEKKFKANQEGSTNKSMLSNKPSSSRNWTLFKNPRIVRVPGSSGNKDRHSKVSTISGLRDRRIRLSVETAIQVYKLQDALGVNQPSKVIDWLIEASKDDINKLPPLPVMPYAYGNSHSQGKSCFLAKNPGIKIDTDTSYDRSNMMPTWKFWDVEASVRAKNKNVEASNLAETLQENQIGHENYTGQVISAQNLFPIPQFPSLPTTLLPYNNPYYHWEPPNLSLSQFSNHDDQNQNPYATSANNALPLAFPSFFCPPPATTFFPYPSSITTPSESNRREGIDHLQFLGLSSQQVLPFSSNVNPWLIHSQNNAGHSGKHIGTGT